MADTAGVGSVAHGRAHVMTHLTDPSRFVGRRIEYDDGGRSVPATVAAVAAVGLGGVLVHGPEGDQLVEPAKSHRLLVLRPES